MYVLCRSGVGRRVSLLVPFYRSNSTASAPEEPDLSPSKHSNARIASSWGNIVIPSREEVLDKIKAESYKPDLSYLASQGSSGLASRLAANLPSSPAPSAGKLSSGSQNSSPAPSESPEEKATRIQALTAARRTQREIREHAAAQFRQAAEAAKAAEAAAKAAAHANAVLLTDKRRFERLRREAVMKSPRNLAVDSSMIEAPPKPLPELRPRPRRVSSTKASNLSKTPSRFSRKPTFRIQSMPSQDANLANAKDDITLEIIENGGDDKEPPEFTIPDVSFTDFDNLFRPSFEHNVETMIHSQKASFSPGQVRILREAYGGDYQRLASQTSEDYVTPPRQLGPLKYAQSVLSHRSDVSARARKNALEIISAAVGGAPSGRTSKAIE